MYIKNLFKHWTYKIFAPGLLLREKYEAFRNLLESDKKSHELIAELEEIYYEQVKIDFALVENKCKQLSSYVGDVVESLTKICPSCYINLGDYFKKIDFYIKLALASPQYDFSPPFILDLDEIDPDSEVLVGGKACNLSLARKILDIPVPRGFAITANCFNYILEVNNLRHQIDEKLAQIDINSASSLERASQELVELILAAQIPEDIEAEIKGAFEGMGGEDQGKLKVSVRSSAVGEDGQASFAGQYRTVLNVDAKHVVDSYKQVIASKYSSRALYYRINYGLSDQATPMAVLVLEMINARASGVIYTRDPEEARGDKLVVHTVWGLGELLVDGSVTPSIITVTRTVPPQLEREEKVIQTVEAISANGGGIQRVPGKHDQPASLALTDRSALRLAEWAMKLEELHGGPQDIEWCMDGLGELFILQSRPLQIEDGDQQAIDCRDVEIENPVLISGGTKACGGSGAGVVYKVEGAVNLESLPEGAVLVAKTPSPDYVSVMGKLNAVVTDVGSSAGHFASVAREFGVPTLVNTGLATENLTSGKEVTVFADGRVVYEGLVPQLLGSACGGRSLLADSPFMARMKKVLSYISPLNLVDPTAESFAPEGCKTFHDILRFAHEKGVHEMFSLGDRSSRRARGAKRLMSDIPIVVYLLDLADGLREDAKEEKEIRVDHITSVPFIKVWKGLSHPDIYWDQTIEHFNWQDVDPTAEGFIRPDFKLLGSYAILSGDYLNFNIHFGYHFVVLDALCGDVLENNYIMLRFAGGGAELYSRHLRVNFLKEILLHHGFKVETKGDLIDAQLMRVDRQTLEEKLETLGLLLASTRVLDMSLRDGSQVDTMVDKFLSGEYDLSPLSRR
jgi:pyruvate,water dikinase